ncbi:MAG: hypothetical protein ABMB14_39965, partial [Myxococcota bacterium]
PEPTEFVDPFAAQPDADEGLTNVTEDLDALLEHGDLIGACDRYAANPGDRKLELLCGKYQFFYEGFGTLGIPAVLFDALPALFTDEVGPAYDKFGLVPHPSSPEGRPIGFGAGAPLGDQPTLALTCAACHFGQLPDGRYAVGAPNHGYDYGRHMLAILLVPQAISPTFDEADHHPDAVRAVRPMLDRLDDEPLLGIQLGLDLLPLASSAGSTPTPTVEQEGQYASWRTGTMDFVIAPLPVDDGIHTVSKILALWGMPTDAEAAEAGMPNAMLAWTGGATSLQQFLTGFVQIGGGDEAVWDAEALTPLQHYIESLRPPEPLDPGDVDQLAAGAAVFRDAGCIDCHGGPRGSGDRVYTFDEIGTDAAMADWADPDGDGAPCCGLGDADTALTHGIKSPRLAGSAAFTRFLHNGSLSSLEELLCLVERPPSAGEPWGDEGHAFGCELPVTDREALVAYLRGT